MKTQKSFKEQKQDFLKKHVWGEAISTPLRADASARFYERLNLKGQKRLLMCSPLSGTDEKTPYELKAHLAGSDLNAFACLARALRERGFSAPFIEAFEPETGFALIEDLGEGLYAHLLREGEEEEKLYTEAVSCLAALYRCSFSPNISWHGASWSIKTYDETALLTEADLFLDWYAPHCLGTSYGESEREVWTQAWKQAFLTLQSHPYGLVLRDFHAENIFYLPEREGREKVGLIDFQDAVFGHPAYDLVSLLEDARREVNFKLIKPLTELYLDKTGLQDRESFYAAYAILGAQRHTKILGIFTRLAKRDHKKRYLAFMPRVHTLLKEALQHPALDSVRSWFSGHAPEILQDEFKEEKYFKIKEINNVSSIKGEGVS